MDLGEAIHEAKSLQDKIGAEAQFGKQSLRSFHSFGGARGKTSAKSTAIGTLRRLHALAADLIAHLTLPIRTGCAGLM